MPRIKSYQLSQQTSTNVRTSKPTWNSPWRMWSTRSASSELIRTSYSLRSSCWARKARLVRIELLVLTLNSLRCSNAWDRKLIGNKLWRETWKRGKETCTGKMMPCSAPKLSITDARILLMSSGDGNSNSLMLSLRKTCITKNKTEPLFKIKADCTSWGKTLKWVNRNAPSWRRTLTCREEKMNPLGNLSLIKEIRMNWWDKNLTLWRDMLPFLKIRI